MSNNEFTDSSLRSLRNPITGLSQFTYTECFQKELKTFLAPTKLLNVGKVRFFLGGSGRAEASGGEGHH